MRALKQEPMQAPMQARTHAPCNVVVPMQAPSHLPMQAHDVSAHVVAYACVQPTPVQMPMTAPLPHLEMPASNYFVAATDEASLLACIQHRLPCYNASSLLGETGARLSDTQLEFYSARCER
eukprot:351002-Chlamydomonas_euryale.AAC.9